MDIALGLIWYVNLLLAMTLHEAAHAWAALMGGDRTAYHGGQVTLSPWPHIQREPFGMVVFPILTFMTGGWMMGWASAPYDPLWARDYPRRAAWMAAAGPAANLLLAILAGMAIRLGLQVGFFTFPQGDGGYAFQVVSGGDGLAQSVSMMLSVMFALNLLLFAFNLIPLPPLDGSAVVTLFMSEEAALWFQELRNNPVFCIIGLVVAWRLSWYVIGPVFHVAQSILF
ncbi:MAG: site-2 protease family protein [Planctomycetes bacterium]|nr:site-2 protease family protein [Planctomycetota bacterium]